MLRSCVKIEYDEAVSEVSTCKILTLLDVEFMLKSSLRITNNIVNCESI